MGGAVARVYVDRVLRGYVDWFHHVFNDNHVDLCLNVVPVLVSCGVVSMRFWWLRFLSGLPKPYYLLSSAKHCLSLRFATICSPCAYHLLPCAYHLLSFAYQLPTICLPVAYQLSMAALAYHLPTSCLPFAYHLPTSCLPFAYNLPTSCLPFA